MAITDPNSHNKGTNWSLIISIIGVVLAIVAYIMGYSFGQGSLSERVKNVQEDVIDLKSQNTAIQALAIRVNSVESKADNLDKSLSDGYARGLQRGQQIEDLKERVTKVESGLGALLDGQARVEKKVDALLDKNDYLFRGGK